MNAVAIVMLTSVCLLLELECLSKCKMAFAMEVGERNVEEEVKGVGVLVSEIMTLIKIVTC